MIIDASEKFTPEEMDEVFEVSIRKTQYYKSPEKKFPGVFRECKKNLIHGVILLAVTLILGIFTKFGVISIIAMTLSAVLTFVAVLWLITLKKAYKESKATWEKGGNSKIEFDEELIGVETKDTTVKIKWSDIGFIKVFNYTVGVFSSDKARALIIPTKYWDPIAKFMEDNNIIVKFYR